MPVLNIDRYRMLLVWWTWLLASPFTQPSPSGADLDVERKVSFCLIIIESLNLRRWEAIYGVWWYYHDGCRSPSMEAMESGFTQWVELRTFQGMQNRTVATLLITRVRQVLGIRQGEIADRGRKWLQTFKPLLISKRGVLPVNSRDVDPEFEWHSQNLEAMLLLI